MNRAILVPLDGSAASEHALPVARRIASASGAVLHLVRVYVPIIDVYRHALPHANEVGEHENHARARTYLEAVRDRLHGADGLRIEIELLDGQVVDALVAYARRVRAGLVVMTTHGRGGATRLWLGGTTDALIERINLPVLLIRPRDIAVWLAPWYIFRRVLIVLDGSTHAEQILGPALALGALSGAHMSSCVSSSRLSFPALPRCLQGGGPARNLISQQRVPARTYLEAVAERIRGEGFGVATQL